jgi:N-acetylneuraminate synthase
VTQFIAEICSNHNGDLARALALIVAAKNVGCWGVKFQLFRIASLFAPELLNHPKYAFVRDRYKWELPLEWLPELAAACKSNGLKFGCTPFYLEAVEQLAPYVDFFKVASYELPWYKLIETIMDETDKHVILSCGMATLEEVKQAVYHQQQRSFDAEYRISLLHCVSQYPALPEDCHLSFIGRLRSEINATGRLGWSDHSVNPGVIYRAVHRYGAQIVEFHLDLDDQAGWEFDQGHCWTPEQIEPVIQAVKDGQAADGGWHYNPADSSDRDFRADPEDGLRPMKAIRKELQPDA